ncbi:MAG: hypothetical protein PF574_00360 [Candidatus Delongbacteria bacterium]|jgi:predicted Zn-ribbon and HTH transcriptional regulator|nr:hypothetical protein [Candidatus Delongbacteria bacterium]
MGAKSSSCFSRKGKSLTEYYTELEAIDSADFIRQAHNNDMIPYRCDKCGLWHLAPKNRQTPSRKCLSCTDAQGKPKELYFSRDDAQRRAEIILREQGVSLSVYECPENSGFHLTKH